jgi:WD40 repeat protein
MVRKHTQTKKQRKTRSKSRSRSRISTKRKNKNRRKKGKEKKLFVAGTDGQGSSVERIKIYDALAQSLNFTSSDHTREVSVLAQLDEDNLFVSGSWDKYLKIWNYF